MTNKNVCCPPFDPKPWDQKILEWKDKKFIKSRVRTFWYMPIGFGKVVAPLAEKMEKAGANPDVQLMLCDHTSKWNMDVYVAVGKEVSGEENITLSGRFLSKVYDGPFKDTGKWCADFKKFAAEKGYRVSKWYMSYTTCPACAKKYGHNYVVIIAEIE